jgi:hypothetical protein
MSDEMIQSLLAWAIVIVMYFFPTILAGLRHKRNTPAIGMLNFWLGWTLLGWVIALVWACTFEPNS